MDEHAWREKSVEILTDVKEWRRAHPKATYYLGHVTTRGTPAIQTTVRYTQVSRVQVKEKLRQMKG